MRGEAQILHTGRAQGPPLQETLRVPHKPSTHPNHNATANQLNQLTSQPGNQITTP